MRRIAPQTTLGVGWGEGAPGLSPRRQANKPSLGVQSHPFSTNLVASGQIQPQLDAQVASLSEGMFGVTMRRTWGSCFQHFGAVDSEQMTSPSSGSVSSRVQWGESSSRVVAKFHGGRQTLPCVAHGPFIGERHSSLKRSSKAIIGVKRH